MGQYAILPITPLIHPPKNLNPRHMGATSVWGLSSFWVLRLLQLTPWPLPSSDMFMRAMQGHHLGLCLIKSVGRSQRT